MAPGNATSRGVTSDETPDTPEALDLFRAGDHAAFERVVLAHRDLVRGIVRRYVRRDEDADDVCQLAFTRAFERRASFRGEAPIRTWLCRIAVNVAINQRNRNADLDLGDELLEGVASFTNALETSKLVAAELWRKAEKHLAGLPPKQRLVVELRLFHDLPFREIGVLADCTEAAARVNYATGIGTLRSILKEART